MNRVTKYITLSLILSVSVQCFSFGQGSSYGGAYKNSAPILYYNGYNNKIIEGLEIYNSASGRCIRLENCSNVTIQNCKFATSQDVAIYLYKCMNITITNCTFENIASGLLAEYSTGVKFISNDVRNCMGPTPGRGQMVHLVGCYGGGNQINYNSCDNISGQSSPEDIINISNSDGINGDPIQIKGNWLRGGGPSTTGGGIMTGDSGGSWQFVQDNICVNTGNYGIGNAGGHDITIRNNKIFSVKSEISNIGLYIWNQQSGITSYNMIVENNEVLWNSKNGVINNFWDAGNSGIIEGWSTNISNAQLNSAILPTKIIGRNQQDTISTSTSVFKLNIHPNPVYSRSIIITSPIPNNNILIISNEKGIKLIEKSIDSSKTEIDTSILANGVYDLKILNNEKIIEERKIKIVKN